METINIWQQFTALIPEGLRVAATITANNGYGKNQAELRVGTTIIVKGESIPIGQETFIQHNEIKVTAPTLAQFEANV